MHSHVGYWGGCSSAIQSFEFSDLNYLKKNIFEVKDTKNC